MLEHVEYEVLMLQDTTRVMPFQAAGTIQNALVESFVIHARSLYEFFWSKGKGDDQFSAWNYVPDWTKVRTNTLGKVPKELKDLRERANARTAHLLIDRVRLDDRAVHWEVQKICDALVRVYAMFAGKASEAGFEIDVPLPKLEIVDKRHAVIATPVVTTTSPPEMLIRDDLDE